MGYNKMVFSRLNAKGGFVPMLYIGEFNFMEEDGQHHGHCTCVAEAEDVDAALEKFESILRSLKNDGELFGDVEDVYLDSCVEISSIPAAGFLAHYTVYDGEKHGSISTSIRGAEPDQCSAYSLDEPEDNEEQEEGYEEEPFLSFSDKPSDA
jgi:hypothetical protein